MRKKLSTNERRIEHLKELSGYHFDASRSDDDAIKILGTFQGADWFSEVLELERDAEGGKRFGFSECAASSAKPTESYEHVSQQFDVMENADNCYAPDHVFLNRIRLPALTRLKAPTLFKMADWFGLETGSVRVKLHIQHPGQIFPLHVDSLKKLRMNDEMAEANKSSRDIWERFNVQLQDWVWGQVWQVGNTHWSGWRAGEIMYHPWWTLPHATANCSYAPRYTLQVTGIATDVTRERIAGAKRAIDLGIADGFRVSSPGLSK